MIKKVFSCFGINESFVEAYLIQYRKQFPGIVFDTNIHQATIDIVLSSDRTLDEAIQIVKKTFLNWIFSEDQHTLPEIVSDLLIQNNTTLAIAESCTGGFIANQLTDLNGASQFFLFSGVTYANQAKEKILQISHNIIEQHGAVSLETAKQMAKQTRELTNATYGLSTSGIAGPTGGTIEKPIGTICIGLSDTTKTDAYTLHFPCENRIENKALFAAAALDLLRRKLLNLEPLILQYEQ